MKRIKIGSEVVILYSRPNNDVTYDGSTFPVVRVTAGRSRVRRDSNNLLKKRVWIDLSSGKLKVPFEEFRINKLAIAL
jgi:hypothetical protein